MNKIFPLLLFVIVAANAIAQQNTLRTEHKVTFNLKITELENPDTVIMIWSVQPYLEGRTPDQVSRFPNAPDANGFYSQVITFPDSLVGRTIAYRYLANGKPDFWDRRTFVLERNQPPRMDLWGFVDGLEGKIKPGQILFFFPNSPEEKTEFAKPFVGITTDGKPVKNLFPIKRTGASTLPVKRAVSSFLESLSPDQKAKCTFPIESDEWRRWHNIDGYIRVGIKLEELNQTQKELAFAILSESLSTKGTQRTRDIMAMEAYLSTLFPDVGSIGGEKYWFTFMGMPSDTEPWGWQLEGHHLAINYFVLGDQVVMTPTFMGSEPTQINAGKNNELRTFEAEERKGLDFYQSLDTDQWRKATLFTKKEYNFNRAEAFRDNEIIPIAGIGAKELTKKQRSALLDLIEEFVSNMKDDHAKIKMEEVRKHLNETYFTWIQGEKLDGPFYYRIQSPVILIEFDHHSPVFLRDWNNNPNQGPAKTHVHTVVRTPNGNDYGRDLLQQHLETAHQQKKN